MISITKTFEFDAAHKLLYHKGKCCNLHGHRFVLEVEITGLIQTEGSSMGMITDYGDLKKIVNEEIIDSLDHAYLNDVCDFYPTSEMLVNSIRNKLLVVLEKQDIALLRIRLYETPTSWAEWRK